MDRLGVIRYIELQLKAALGLGEGFLLDADKEFSHYGMNSIASARFCYVLSQDLGQEIAPKALLDNYTLDRLAQYLTDELKLGGLPWSELAKNAKRNVRYDDPEIRTVAAGTAALSAGSNAAEQDDQRLHRPDRGQQQKHALVDKIIQALKSGTRTADDTGFSFIFFSSSGDRQFDSKYDYVVNIARYADANDFKAVWVPERHFFEFGGVFPDPGMLLANIASHTSSIRLRSGSVVLPLHHPTRVAESWSMLDNLSNGRVDMAFASGWNPNDFVSSPHTYATLRETWFERMAEVERLWRGEAVEYYNGKQQLVPIKVYPRPIQKRLNIWMAITSNEQSFIEAGKRGYNVLTMLMSKSIEELAANIGRYRQARTEAGFDPDKGIVTLMLHTYVHDDPAKVERCVNEHYFDYIKSGLKGHIQSLPKAPSEAEINRIVEHSFHYQRKNSALFGDVSHCQAVVSKLQKVGVNEIACLVDFGISEAEMYETLPFIKELKNRVNNRRTLASSSIASPVAERSSLINASSGTGARPVSTDAAGTTASRNTHARPGEFAIVGMAGRYPAARSVEEFWRNLMEQRNCLSEMTAERYDWRSIYGDPRTESGRTNIKYFGLIDDIYDFDAGFFRISNREGELMDPHARLLLETVWQTIENAGLQPAALNGSKTGVFLSFYNDEYGQLLDGVEIEKSSEPYLATALSGTIKANRISFILGLTGPSEVYDTACSSSLVALHRAMQSIAAGDCAQAIVAGVSLLLSPSRVVALSKMGILNEGNICNPYSYPANREVIGEGVGALLIKPLAAAEADRDHIYAVVCGSDVSHQGNSSGHLTMPSAKALAELIDRTYSKLDLDRTQVSYFEGHGSGNDSDVVELMAVQQSFKGLPADKRIALGSVKSNIGFGEASGGVAQLTKCALSLHHAVVPATLHFTQCDPSFDLAATNIEVLGSHKQLPANTDHYVSVLAYGLGGSNAHVVLRNYRGSMSHRERTIKSGESASGALYPMIFSAGSAAALTRYLEAIYRYLDDAQVRSQLERRFSAEPGNLLLSLARTLIGRERHAAHRVVFLASTYASLLESMSVYLSEGANSKVSAESADRLPTNAGSTVLPIPGANAGQLRAFLDTYLEHKRIDKLALIWVNGADFEWQSLYGNSSYQRIALPPAPFAGRKLRLVGRATSRTSSDAPLPIASSANRLKWSKTPTGVEATVDISADEYFIREHVVDGKPVLPGVAYLAILIQIARQVFGLQRCTVRNIAWLMPFELAGAASATMQFTFDAHGYFRVVHLQRKILCCKGQLEISEPVQHAAQAERFRARLKSVNFSDSALLLDRERYWSLVNSAEAKQVHGDSMRSLTAVYQQEDACVAVLSSTSATRTFAEIPLFDGAMGATVGMALLKNEQLSPSVPFSIEAFHSLAPMSSSEADYSQQHYAVVNRRDGKLPKYDISLENARGAVLAVFSGFFAKTFDRLPAAERADVTVALAVPAGASALESAKVSSQPADDRSLRQRLVNEIHGRIAAFLKADPDAVPIDEGLESLGLDSIGVNEITEQLSQALAFELPVTLMFEYPNIGEMATYLLEEFSAEVAAAFGGEDIQASSAAAPAARDDLEVQGAHSPPVPVQTATYAKRAIDSDAAVDDIAVVGIGGVYPGSSGVQEFWQKLTQGHDFISEMPVPRRDAVHALFPESVAQLGSLYGGFVADADCFDAEFFGLSDEQALAMDPQQRLFLVACWQAIEDAGYFPQSLAGRNIGVYVGAIANEYLQTITMAGFTSVHVGTGGALSGIANRSSYFFDLNGPSQSIDAACCSSLYALDRAVKDIRAGTCEGALAGGVSYIGTPHGFVAYAGMNYLAKDWRCKAFADGGDGWSKGELFAAVYLKPYRRAVADNDAIYAVITGSGTNHGGKSHFYEQPNSNKHAELIARVYREGRVDPAQLVHIEAHGTGTEMGDALEFNVLQKSLKSVAKEQDIELPNRSCAVGSVKSNIGHTEAAAGIAGFIKTVLLVHHRIIPPSLHIAVANKHLRLEKSPLYLADERRDLRGAKGTRRIFASVHSFNFSGAAAHVLVAEARHKVSNATLNLRRYPVCISARSPEALRAYLGALAAHIDNKPDDSLDGLVYTINSSKSCFAHRLATVVESKADLSTQLHRALSEFSQLQQQGRLGEIRYSATQSHTKKITQHPQLSDLTVARLVEQWLDQSRFSWSTVLAPFAIAKLHLPTYPFTDRKLCFAVSGEMLQALRERPTSVNTGDKEIAQEKARISDPAPVKPVPGEPTPRASHQSRRSTERVKSFVRDAIAELFALGAADVDLEDTISAYPFESLTLVRLCDKVNQVFGLQSTPPDYFAFVSLADIAAFIDDELGRESSAVMPAAEPEDLPRSPQVICAESQVAATDARAQLDPSAVDTPEDAIAIIGMSGAFPGSSDIHSFWQVLCEGRDCISEIPSSRWDWRAADGDPSTSDGKGAAQWGGFIAGMEEFDPLFFGISPREAQMMDPQQRLLLTHAWQAIEDAGYAPSQLAGSSTAVFVGLGGSGFEQVLSDAHVPVGAHAATGLSPCIGPNRISFILDLHGPSEAVDTACSSSLIALHRAAQCLRSGESDLALAGGVNIIISSVVHASLNSAGMLSEDGRCKTFSDKANGYVRGEGIGVLLLKRLMDAQRSGDHIYAVIRGSAENHGGRANSLTAPNPNAQAQLLVSAYRNGRIDPRTVTYIEAHGTGTKLGDPIEINGLKGAFKTLQQASGEAGGEAYCGLGSVKTNIGHLEYAAGVAGVIKVLLQMRHRQLVKSLHCEVSNPYIALAGSPFYVVRAPRSWDALKDTEGRELPRRAGVSSLGFGGANAHVVLEEYVSAASEHLANAAVPDISRIIVLSAKSAEQIRQQAARLCARLEQGDYQESDLPRIAYTLQVGRDAMDHRLAFSAENLASLQGTLKAVAEDSASSTQIFRGKRDDSKDTLEIFNADAEFQRLAHQWLATGKLSNLLVLWVRGFSFDWSAFYAKSGADGTSAAQLPRRISLPTYPFRKNVYWPKAASAAVGQSQEIPAKAASAVSYSRSAELSRVAAASSQPKRKISLQHLSAGAAEVEESRPARQPLQLVPVATVATGAESVAANVQVAVPAAPEVRSSQAELLATLKKGLSTALYIDVVELAADKAFAELGLDSVLAVEWVRWINQQLQIEMPVAKLYDHPTLAQLAQFVHGLVTNRAVPGETGAISRQPISRQQGADQSAQLEAAVVSAVPSQAERLPEEQLLSRQSSENSVPADLTDIVRRSLAAALYLEPTEIATSKPFVELGLDSVIAVEWMRHLNQRFGINLPVIKLYDYPNVAELAGYIAAELQDSTVAVETSAQDHSSTSAQVIANETRSADQDVARGLVICGVRTLDELQLQPWVAAPPRPDEVTIQVRASAINFPDTLCVNGIYPTMPSYPFVPGFEVSGIVSAVGAGVTGLAVGDAVIALTGDQLGGHAQQVNVSSQSVMPKPANISFEEACCMPVVFGTVYCAFALGKLRRNEHVLIQTATGGCGLMALQLARLSGCICYGTSSRPEKLDILKRLQVPHVLNYQSDFEQDIKRITGGRGVDVVLNMVAGEAMQKGLNSLAPSGRYLELAVHALKARAKFDLSHLVDNQAFLSMDFRRLSMSGGGQRIAPAFAAMVRLLESEQIVPIVSRIYPFAQIKAALSYVGKGAHIGKVVISHQVDQMIDCAEQCIERMLAQHRRAQRQPLSASGFRLEPELSESSVDSNRTALPGQAGRKQAQATSPENIGIAVIGMAGQFPQAADLASYWRNIAAARDCISEVPVSRWSTDEFYDADRQAPGKSYCKWMGVIEDADEFDPLFFSISPAEAKLMDPQQRLFLQACWHCIEDAGINPDGLSGARCGVFVGCTQGLYGQSGGSDDLDAQGLMGGNAAILAARISYFLNLKGPSLAIDTACSSSLVAINEACNYLQLGKVDLALAGGVNVLAGPGLHIMTSKAGMLSPQGRCFTFDNKADGFVPGEGVGVLLLKNLARALEDGDPIHGVIRGWGVNQDGKTNGITAPSPGSQIQLQKQVYEEFDLSPETITLVEAHGTGTKLGDPIEVSALIESFRAFTARQHYCALGSVKSNIGHTLTAAGVAGVIKTLLALKHRQLPPTVQFKQLNEHIALAGSPFVINTELRPWRVAEGAVRRAAVSSFSFSGTNAHLVVEEAPERNARVPQQPAYLIVLSARSSKQLRQQAHQLAEYAAANTTGSLASVSYTLLTGRKHFPHRLATIVSTEQELEQYLREWLASDQSPRVLSGHGNEVDLQSAQALPLSSVKPADHHSHLRKLGERFCLGESLQPAQAFAAITLSSQRLHRTALPGYPFAKESYWIGNASSAVRQPGAARPLPARTNLPARTELNESNDVGADAGQKQWMFIAEKPLLDPLPKSIDWQDALGKVAAKKLLIVADDEEGSSLASLVTQLAKSRETAPGTSSGMAVETVAYRDLSIETLRAIPDTVIICGPFDRSAESPRFIDQDIRNVFDVCRLFMRKAWDSPIRFYCVYGSDEKNPAIDCEALSGLLSSAAMENSHHRWTLISCDRSVDANRKNQIILQEWLSGAVEESGLPFVEVRYRDSQRWSTRLQAVKFEPSPPSIFRAKATYLITGGLGPMGMLLCTELARRYQARLVILSRSPLNDEQHEKIDAIESLGATVHYFSVDITDQAALTAAYRAVKSAVGDLHGVMLLANQVQDGIIANKTWESFARETATKTKGTLYIDQLTAGEPLEFFLLFSSVAAYGLAGSAGYSYSSAFQNAFARYRNNLGRTGARSGFSLSCCWGPWTIDYYLRQAHGEDRLKKFAAQGTDLITIEAAFPLIQASALVRRDALGMVAICDAERFSSLMMLDGRAARPSVTKSALLDGFAWFVRHLERWERNQLSGGNLSIATVEEIIALEEIRKLPPDLIRRLYKLLQAEEESGRPGAAAETGAGNALAEIVDAIAEALAAALELQSVSHDEPFQNYGLDSIVAMKLVTRLERRLNMSIEPKWLIDFPTVRTLAAHLTTQESLKATT